MNIKYNCIITVLFTSLFLSCQNKESLSEPQVSNKIHFITNLDVKHTRANLKNDGSGVFTEGDTIKILIKNENRIFYSKIFNKNSNWTSSNLYWDNIGKKAQFSAWFGPINVTKGEILKQLYSIPINQSLAQDYQKADILHAFTEASASDGNVILLNFKHVMSRIHIKFSSPVSNVRLYAGNVGYFDFFTGEISSISKKGKWFIPFSISPLEYICCVFPTMFVHGQPWIQYTLGGKEEAIMVPEKIGDRDFEQTHSGKEIAISVNTDTKEITPLTSTKVDDPDLPYWVDEKTPKWKNHTYWIYKTYGPSYLNHASKWTKNQQLYWKKEYGWYDCNKIVRPDGGEYADSYQCWAASASNMVHWWIRVNWKYIQKFVRLSSTSDYDKSFPYYYPEKQSVLPNSSERNRSAIFTFYSNAFTNSGGYIDEGVNWFITGTKPSKPYKINLSKYNAGFFKKVFPADKELCRSIRGIGRRIFNQYVKEALLKHEAIGISNAGHALTLWGFEFDKNGEVAYIYISDNDYGDLDGRTGGSLYRAKIRYEISDGATRTMYYFPNNDPKSALPIAALNLLRLGTDEWENYLKNNK